MQTVQIDVEGMSCQHCVKTITEGIGKAVAGAKVQVDLAAGKVRVDAESALDKQQIADVIENLGFDVKS